jgi:hypothetical protein
MRRLALAAALALGASAARASDAAPAAAALAVSASSTTDKSQLYSQEGPIVNNAASFIGVITVIPAAVIGAVACPVAMSGTKSGDKTYQQRYKDCVAAGTASGTQYAYRIGGFPFLMLKRAFWDYPRRAFQRAAGPKKSSDAPAGR